VKDYHAKQMTGTSCQGRNCAAASAADAIYMGTRGRDVLTADDVRRESRVSCIPGRDTASGGLTVNAVESVGKAHGVSIDYRGGGSGLKVWTADQGKERLGTYYGGILLGMYRNVAPPWRAHGSTFGGGHSLFVHDYREDMADTSQKVIQPTVCWHDPLRPRSIRVPWRVVTGFWQSGTEIKGLAGWARIPAIGGGSYATPMTDRTRVKHSVANVHDKRTTGTASTIATIKPEGKLVEVAMYAKGESYQGSKEWGALSLLGDKWVHLKRLDHTRGKT
jgi:hypothetical protein